jgi:hypothetical protein
VSGNQREEFEEAARRFREVMEEMYPGPGQAQARLAQIEAHEALGTFGAESRGPGAQQDEVKVNTNGPVPVPGSLRELSRLFSRVRAEFDRAGKEAGQRPVTNRQIGQLAYLSSTRHAIPGRPNAPLTRVPADGHLSVALKGWAESVADVSQLVVPAPALAFHIVKGLGGTQRDARTAYELAERARAERARAEREERRAARNADPAPPEPPADGMRAVVQAVLAQLLPPSKPGRLGKLPAAVELALCEAITAFGTENGKASLTWPLLDPDGFLADPEIAAILARALTGGYLAGAPALGRAWARAFLDGTRSTELTADAELLLGYLWQQARRLRPLTDLAESRRVQVPGVPGAVPAGAPQGMPHNPPPRITEKELRRRLSFARELVADYDRMTACDMDRTARNLPPRLRSFLIDQTQLVAGASRGFVGRESVLAQMDAFIESDEGGYCFIRAAPGVGKTALLAHLVADHPDYARHFNVRSGGVFTAGQFLNNVCAQLIGAYRLDPGLFPRSGGASTDLLGQLLEQSAAKARGDKLVVVIDGLDEAVSEARKPGTNPLGLPRSLPEGCRFIVTVRDGTQGWEPDLDPGCAARHLYLDADSDENMEDARAYVRSRLASPAIARYLLMHKMAGEEFTEELVARSQGSFLYLRYVLDQYDWGGELVSRELTGLPAGLGPYYEDLYERMRAGTPQRQWEKVRLPVLIQLAIAEQPLTLDELTAGAGQRTTAPVMSAIGQWREFLVETSTWRNDRRVTAYRLFHESFRKFLKERHKGAAMMAELERMLREDMQLRASLR